MTNSEDPQVGAVLVVERERLRWFDSARRYRVLVDGEEVARLANGESCRVPLTRGRHEVQARIDWTGSEPEVVMAKPGHTVTIVVRWRGHILSRRRYLVLKPVIS
jgi:hypothetical protein